MEETEALKIAQDMLDNSNASRARYESLCGLWLCYTYGPQWAQLTGSTNMSSGTLRYIKPIINPEKRNVRIAMNLIQPRVQRTNARLMPRELDYNAVPSSRASNDTVAALVATSRMKQFTEDPAAIKAIRRASLWRCVLGSVVVRRTMQAVGEPVIVRTPDGKPSVGPNGPRTLKTYRNTWNVCPPYEFIRDSSARTTEFEDEECIGHERPKTTKWLKRNYGLSVESKATMGQLLEFQRFLYSATGQTLGQGFGESKLPALMVSEWWFKDDRQNEDNLWPWRLMAYRDTRGEGPGDRQLQALEFGPNPYYHLPLHHLFYDNQLVAPWALGIPSKTIPPQDSYNIAHTSMLRAFVSHGATQWLVEHGSLVDGVKAGLTNMSNQPIVYYGTAKNPPKRVESAQIDSTVRQILTDSQGWMDQALNQAPVQSGEAVKRGEAKSAYEFRKDAADTPLTAILDEDELTINQLLTGTMRDILKTESPRVTANRLSHKYTIQQILTLTEQDPGQTLAGIKIVRETLRPRTTLETKEDFNAAIQSGIVDPITARRSMLIEKGIAFDIREKRACEYQLLEISSLLNGDGAEVYLGQQHEMHQYVLSLEMDSQRFNAYSSGQKKAIQQHWTEHEEFKQIQRQLEQPAQPVPDEIMSPDASMASPAGPGGMGAQEMQPPLNSPAGEMFTPPGLGSPGGFGGEGIASGPFLPQAGGAQMAPMPSAPVGAGY
jgi:hypothetical protein